MVCFRLGYACFGLFQVVEGMVEQGMDGDFMSILGEFLEGYSKCAVLAGTTAEQFQTNLGTLIKVRAV